MKKTTQLIILLALLLVSGGVKAQDVQEASVSSTKTWTFNNLTTGTSYTATSTLIDDNPSAGIVGGYYLRATESKNITVNSIEEQTLTFVDGTQVTVNKVLATNAKVNAPSKELTAGSSTTSGNATLAFNASVPGTMYVKIKATAEKKHRIYFANNSVCPANTFTSTGEIDEIAYTSHTAGTFFVANADVACEIYAVRFVPATETRISVSDVTNWTFDNNLIGVGSAVYAGEGLYLRGYSALGSGTVDNTEIGSGRTLTNSKKSDTDPASVIFDDFSVDVTNVITSYTAIAAPNSTTLNAESWDGGNKGAPMVAIKTSVPGTLYVAMTPSADGSGTSRIYFGDGTNTPSSVSSGSVALSTAGTVYYPSATSTVAGSFFVGATVACKIYAMRFIPATYALTTSASPSAGGLITKTLSSGSMVGDNYVIGSVVTLTATPADGYKFVNWTDDNDSDAELSTSETYDITMSKAQSITAHFVKAAATTVWKFDQYYADDALISSTTNSAATEEYTNGLYFHTKSQTNANHSVKVTERKNDGSAFSSRTTTYAASGTYMAVTIGKAGTNTVSATDEAAQVACDGISYKAISDGTFYATFYSSSAISISVYKNSTSDPVTTTFENKQGKEISVSVNTGDIIYMVNGSSNVGYLLEACFIPTTADAMTKTVTIGSAGMASFSATQNYVVPEGLKAYTATSINGDRTMLTEITGGVIPACTGVVLKGDAGTYTLTSTESASAVTGNLLKANIADYNLPQVQGDYTNYTLAASGFVKVKSTDAGTLAAGKAFLRVTTPAASGAKEVYLMDFSGEVTGIDDINDNVNANKKIDGKVYSITGQLMGSSMQGLPKGIYIVNGKKYIYK